MIPTWRGRRLGFYMCRNEKGTHTVVMATTPDQARDIIRREGFTGYFTASFMGYVFSRPAVIYANKPSPLDTLPDIDHDADGDDDIDHTAAAAMAQLEDIETGPMHEDRGLDLRYEREI